MSDNTLIAPTGQPLYFRAEGCKGEGFLILLRVEAELYVDLIPAT